MLALLRRVPAAVDDVQKGDWDRDQFKGRRAFRQNDRNYRLRPIGPYRRKISQAFDTRILVSDPHIDHEITRYRYLAVTLEDLLRKSDIVSLHVSLSAATQGFFGKEQFSRMKTGAWFINTARGRVGR